jgi:hypothetical protein
MPPAYHGLRRRQAALSGTRRLTLIAGAFGCGLLSAGAIWEYANHRSQTIPVIEADGRPLRVKPENPGGMQIAGASESILSGPEQIPQSLAPPPEAPDPGSLHMQEQSARAHDDAAPPSVLAGLTAQAISPPAADPAPLPNAPVAAAVQAPAPVQVAAAQPRVAQPQPVPATSGGRQVQLAAVGSEAAANAEWTRLAHLMPELLGHRRPEISHIERDGHVFWRVRTSGFADAAAVTNFCSQVHAKGAACTQAGF